MFLKQVVWFNFDEVLLEGFEVDSLKATSEFQANTKDRREKSEILDEKVRCESVEDEEIVPNIGDNAYLQDKVQ